MGRPRKPVRVMRARKASTCWLCAGPVAVGAQISRTADDARWAHVGCAISRRREQERAGA